MRIQTGMKQGTLNRADMLEHRIQHLTEMPETCWSIVSNITIMDICFSNNAANTNTQHKVLKVQLYMLIFVQVCSTIDKIYKSKNKVLVLEEQLRAKESPRELGCKSESEDIRV